MIHFYLTHLDAELFLCYYVNGQRIIIQICAIKLKYAGCYILFKKIKGGANKV